jgi:hypothetical protein
MNHIPFKGISIQVCLSGYSFKIKEDGKVVSDSSWNGSDKVFTDPSLQDVYDEVDISIMTPKVAMVPSGFFSPVSAREFLARTSVVGEDDLVQHCALSEWSAELVYSLSMGEKLSRVISQNVSVKDGGRVSMLPEMYFILKDLQGISEYNKIVASFAAPYLHLAVGQGRNLLLANVFEAADFTTAEYFIFMVLKKLQLNPEVSSISFRTPLSEDEEMSLYRYFKGVERL